MKKNDHHANVIYWLDIAQYDLDTAKALLKTRRNLYVGFMCHQVIEKTLKAFFWALLRNEPPYTHNIIMLVDLCGLKDKISTAQTNLINRLMPLNIQARYPKEKNKLARTLNLKTCEKLLNETLELAEWIKKSMPL